ncbi:MAG: nitroreductase family protein [Bacillota bacterium]
MLRDLVLKNRSYRRFYQQESISLETLSGLIDLARLTGSGANRQPLKYFLVNSPGKNALVFETLSWAGYLKDWPGPDEGERPSAYIVILGDKEISSSFDWDRGIAAQTILLGAVEQGLGGCMIVTIDRVKLAGILDIPSRYEILMVLALGKPKEKVVLETLQPGGDIKYWRDSQGVHHVPKRPLDEIIVGKI